MAKNKSSAGRPLMGNKKRVRVSFTLHPDDVAWLTCEAANDNTTKSAKLDQILHEAQMKLKQKREINISLPTEQIKKVCQKFPISRLSLFGSVLTDQFGPESDLDFLVEFQKDHQPGYFQLIDIQHELSQLFPGREIDLKTPKELSRYFRRKVLKQAELIYRG